MFIFETISQYLSVSKLKLYGESNNINVTRPCSGSVVCATGNLQNADRRNVT